MEIFLDHASGSFLKPKARNAMLNAFDSWANPSSNHYLGKQNQKHLNKLKETFREKCNIDPNSAVIFLSGVSEGNALVYNSSRLPILKSEYEHASNKLNPKGSLFSFKDLSNIDSPHLISCLSVHNETGLIIKLDPFHDLLKANKCEIHIDAAQEKNINFKASKADYMVVSSNKMGGPIGIAAVISKPNLRPFVFGKQQHGFRGGTEALPLIAGFVEAIDDNSQHFSDLNRFLKSKIDSKYFLSSHCNEEFADHIVCLVFDFSASELIAFFDFQGIYISAGSACDSGAMDGIKAVEKYGFHKSCAIRVSFGWNTSKAEVEIFAQKFNQFVQKRSLL
jgi:cysteine desulfurase